MKATAPSLILMIIIAAFSSNCVSYHNQWYNVSIDPAENVTIDVFAQTLGPTPIKIMDTEDDCINVSISYYREPVFRQFRNNSSLKIYTEVTYADHSDGNGASIFIYLPGNSSYNININNAALESTRYGKDSETMVKYSKGNITVNVNDPKYTPTRDPQYYPANNSAVIHPVINYK